MTRTYRKSKYIVRQSKEKYLIKYTTQWYNSLRYQKLKSRKNWVAYYSNFYDKLTRDKSSFRRTNFKRTANKRIRSKTRLLIHKIKVNECYEHLNPNKLDFDKWYYE